jgi:hypothetical protein
VKRRLAAASGDLKLYAWKQPGFIVLDEKLHRGQLVVLRGGGAGMDVVPMIGKPTAPAASET